MKVATVCFGIFLLSSSASSAEDSGSRGLDQPVRTRACGHTTELEAAKRALAEGNREGALNHLQRARALVAECERNAVDPAPEGESTTPASAFAKAKVAGPEDSPIRTGPRKSHPGSGRSPPHSHACQPGSA